MKLQIRFLTICSLVLTAVSANAHHSFSAFDFSSETTITGELTRFDIVQPHVMLALEVSQEDGSKQKWVIESVVPRQWRLRELDPEFAEVGETVTLIGWRDHDGDEHMMLKTMIGEKGTMVVRDDLGPDSNRNGANSGGGEGRQREGRSENRRRARELEEVQGETESGESEN